MAGYFLDGPDIYLINSQIFQRYKIMIVCHLYGTKPFEDFQNCVLCMCKRQTAPAVERVQQM